MVFANLDFRGKGNEKDPATWDCNRDDFAHRSVEALRDAKSRGARGLKFFKSFGLEYKNADGSFLRIDDERFDPIWDVCGELGLAVIMHTADPSAFFDAIDAQNERYEELSRRPDWSFYGRQVSDAGVTACRAESGDRAASQDAVHRGALGERWGRP